MTAAKVILKEQCPKCADEGLDTSEDNQVTFQSGVRHCHRHGVLGTSGAVMVHGIRELEPVRITLDGLISNGEYADIKSRGILKKTCEFYGYQVQKDKGVHIANYYDDAGNVKMQQHRTSDKKFPIYGDKSYNDTLWGMHKFTPSDNVFITITEGHIDALSVAQVFDCKYPVVSLPNGANSGYEVIKRNLHKLSQFKYVILAFDNDKPGREATEECISLFEPGKVRVAKWKRKDANEYFNGKTLEWENLAELRQTIYNAVAYLPPSILTGESLLNTLKGYNLKSIPWPWKSFNERLHGIDIPSVITIAGLPEHGKTTMMADIMRYEIKRSNKVGVISLEQSIPKLLLKTTSLLTGFDIKKIRNRDLTDEEREYCRETAESIVTHDHRTYGSDINVILKNLPYIAQALNCEVIIFDNLSYSISGGRDEERREIDRAMIALKDSSTKYEYVLFNICHLNDNDDNKDSIRGSRGVQMYSDYVIHISRDFETDTLWSEVMKDREEGEDTGKKIPLKYNKITRGLEDL